MSVDLWVWGVTIAVIIGLLIFDFFAHVRVPHEPSMREAAWWSAFYISIALVFGGVVWAFWGATFGGEYFVGFVTEKSLSIDNLFVFLIIMSSFKVPRAYQQKVLMVGIIAALVLRGIFIAIGATAIEQYSWIFYIFGAFLIYTAYKLAVDSSHTSAEDEHYENAMIRFVQRVVPTTDAYHSDRLTVKIEGKRVITPMLIVMLAIGSADLLFAFDSIPAIFGLTQEPYIVFTANAFALLGLRQLFFVIGGLLDRLVYLSIGLAFILAFIGLKLFFHALHVNELPFINGGENVDWAPEINPWLSLSIIVGAVIVATVASLAKTRSDERNSDQI
ncbi:MAG: TerC family protein [Thermomicrobiales bacterium]